MINYVDRINISVAAGDIMADTGWSKTDFGLVFSTFLLGYALFQYPGGALADRWSARKVVALSCIGFSLFTALTPLGANALVLLLVMRFMVGACESMTFPSFASLNSRWIPRGEFARAQAVLLSGVFLGQIVAYPTTAWIVENLSWQMVFYINAGIGMVWVAAWYYYVRDSPREHPRASEAEVTFIESQVTPKRQGSNVSLLSIIRCKPIPTLCVSYMLYGFIAWLFIFWFPTYLTQERGLSTMQMGMIGMLPIGAGFLGVQFGGWFSDWMLKNGWSPRAARVRVSGLMVVLGAPFLVLGVNLPAIGAAITAFGIFYFLFSASLGGFWSLPLELSPEHVGSIIGVMNSCANFAGLFGPLAAGRLIDATQSFTLPFYLAALLCLFCGGIYALLVPADPIEIEI
jgi:MFS family permease